MSHASRAALFLAVVMLAAGTGWVSVHARSGTPAERPSLRERSTDVTDGGRTDRRTMWGRVAPGEEDAWTLRFVAGRAAGVSVSSESPSLLGCAVHGAAGTLLASGRSGPACSLRWTPVRTGSYQVRVRNPGAAAVAYRLATY